MGQDRSLAPSRAPCASAASLMRSAHARRGGPLIALGVVLGGGACGDHSVWRTARPCRNGRNAGQPVCRAGADRAAASPSYPIRGDRSDTGQGRRTRPCPLTGAAICAAACEPVRTFQTRATMVFRQSSAKARRTSGQRRGRPSADVDGGAFASATASRFWH